MNYFRGLLISLFVIFSIILYEFIIGNIKIINNEQTCSGWHDGGVVYEIIGMGLPTRVLRCNDDENWIKEAPKDHW